MLSLPARLLDELVRHAYAEHPLEACGVVVGPVGGAPNRWLPLPNAAGRTDYYEVDSATLLRTYSALDAAAEEVKVVCHSHTSTAAFPSQTDIDLAGEPQAHYLIVSTRSAEPELRAFRIVDGDAVEVDLQILADS